MKASAGVATTSGGSTMGCDRSSARIWTTTATLNVLAAAGVQDEIGWFENDGDSGTWTCHWLSTGWPIDGASSLSAADMIGDGLLNLDEV